MDNGYEENTRHDIKTIKEQKLNWIVSIHGLEKDERASSNWTPPFMEGKLSNQPHVLTTMLNFVIHKRARVCMNCFNVWKIKKLIDLGLTFH